MCTLRQAIYPFEESIALICNDEGKIFRLPFNHALRHPEIWEIYDIIADTFFLCSAPPDKDNFVSLINEQLLRYEKLFKTSESFICSGTALTRHKSIKLMARFYGVPIFNLEVGKNEINSYLQHM